MAPASSLQENPRCPQCKSKYTVRKGKRRNRLRTLQIFQCAECLLRFTSDAGKSKTYPLKTILDAVSAFNLGHSLTDTQRILHARTHLQMPERTIRRWLEEYKPLTSYARLRAAGQKLFHPDAIVRSFTLYHQSLPGTPGEARIAAGAISPPIFRFTQRLPHHGQARLPAQTL